MTNHICILAGNKIYCVLLNKKEQKNPMFIFFNYVSLQMDDTVAS